MTPDTPSTPPCSRRDFLMAAGAASLGLVLCGCGQQETGAGEGGFQAPPAPIQAVKNADDSWTIPSGGTLKAGAAIAFTRPDGEPGVVFKTQDGTLRALSARCTHSGCTVAWTNEGKEHLHCPCHGSNFDPQGRVLNGPANAPLPAYAVQAKGQDAVVRLA